MNSNGRRASSTATDTARPHAVTVLLHGEDRADLLSVVSALHRRGVEILDAELTRAERGRREFRATVVTTQRQAGTVEATLANLVNAIDVQMKQLRVLGAVESGGGPLPR